MKKITQREVARATVGKKQICPFCGEVPVAEPWHGGGPRKIRIGCDNELCFVQPSVTGETPKQALEYWREEFGLH